MEKYIHYLQKNFFSPEQYIINKFIDHEVLLLGEDHAIKNNLDFVINLIPQLYDSGIYTLGMEFGASETQDELDLLTTGEFFDDIVAKHLMFQYNVRWAYKEYMDVYKAVWNLNRSLPEDARKFRILNLSYIYQWEDFSGFKTPMALKKIFPKGNIEKFRTELIEREVISKGEKILILTGTPHAYTRFKNPILDVNGDHFYSLQGGWLGNRLFEKFGSKIFSIMIHQPQMNLYTQGPTTTSGIVTIEKIMEILDNKPMGFDLLHTIMGDINDDSFNSIPYENFTLKEMFDGYLFLKPIKQLEGCTVDYDFLNNQSFKEVQRNWPDVNWTPKPPDEATYWKEVESYVNLEKRYFFNNG